MSRRPVEIDIDKVEALAAQGLGEGQIADSIGINPRTLYRYKLKKSEIAEAIKRGRAKGIAVATNKLFELIREKNLGAICFYLKCKGGWKEQDEQQQSQSQSIKVVLNG